MWRLYLEPLRLENQEIPSENDTAGRPRTIRFKKLLLQGFKSFPDATELTFNENICAIVGPNGCGKSNILDALRWVLGEQGPSQLRARSMSDVIFNGSANRKPVGMAEITLVIECPAGTLPLAYEEIEITRRLYRSGESEYFINRTLCRLKDITDLFLDTGVGRGAYALIEQGRVDALVTARPDERRTFLEQIAGIEKYKVRKKEALSKLVSTEQNLARVKDVVGEVNTRRISLARQARKAVKFRTIRKERDDMQRILIGGRYSRFQIALKNLEDQRTVLENHMARNAARLGLQSVVLQESRKQVDAAQENLRKTAEEIDQAEHRLDYLENRIRDLDERHRELEAEMSRGSSEADSLDRQCEVLEGKAADLDREGADLKALLDSLKDESAMLEEQHRELNSMAGSLRAALSDARTLRLREVTELAALRNRLASADERLRFLTKRLSELEVEIRQIQIEQNEASRLHSEVGLKIEEQERLRNELGKHLLDIRLRSETAEALRQESADRLKRIEADHLSVSSRLMSLREVLAAGEGLDSGVKAVLNRFGAQQATAGAEPLIRGTIADLYETTEEHEKAVAAALYQFLQDIVAVDGSAMDEVCRFLLAEKLSRVTVRLPEVRLLQDGETLVPADGGGIDVPIVGTIPVPSGGAIPVRSLVRVDDDFAMLFDRLLGNVFMASDPDAASRGACEFPDAVFVTPCGLRWDAGGARTIGRAPDNRLAYRQRRTEIRDLERKEMELSSLREDARRAHGEFQITWQNLEAEALELRKRMTGVEQELAVSGRDLEHRKSRVEQIAIRYAAVCREQTTARSEESELTGARNEVAQALERMEERTDGAKAVDDLEGRLEGVTAEMAVMQEKLTECRIRMRSTTDRVEFSGREKMRLIEESRRFREMARNHRAEILKKRELLGAGSAQKLELQSELRVLMDDDPVRKNRMETMKARLMQVRRAEEEIAAEVAELEKADRQMEREIADIRVAKASLDSALTALQDETAWNPAEEAAALGRVPDDSEIEDWKKQAELLQENLNLFSDVNLGAEHEHRELVERSRFLDEQLQDLESAIASLRTTIQQINRTSKTRFMDAFEVVNRHFGSIFQGLFDGGEASLELIDPDDPLETGVDIMCRPPGKRARTIDLLSGGEKALAALALLLAGFRFKPSPLLFLDEVDAPLDDHNVVRFTRFLKSLAEVTQVVMITHNSVTMEAADILYGVTMENPGISRLVSARLKMFAG